MDRFEKRPTFWCSADDGEAPGHMGDADSFKKGIADALWAYVECLEPGETLQVTIGRRDLSITEEEALPEL